MAPCIVYYSRSGNTRFVAELLAGQKKGTLVPLEERGRRRGLLGFLKSGYQASTGRSSRLLGEPWEHIKDCPSVYILTPVWAGKTSPAVNAFLEHADLQGKQVYIVTLQMDSAHKGSDRVHQSLAERIRRCGGEVGAEYSLHSAGPGKFAGEEHLRREAEKIG